MTGKIPPKLALRMTIVRGITILNPPATGGIGNPYSHTFRFFGGTAPISSEIISSLPSGWSYNTATNTLSNASPDTAGPITITVYARDATFDYELTQTFTFNIVALPLEITNSFSDYSADVAQSFDYTTSGGAAGAKTFAVTSGELPPGLTLDSNGHMHGTTTGLSIGPHSYMFGVTAVDSLNVASEELIENIIVTQHNPAITFTGAFTSPIIIGQAYTSDVLLGGGDGSTYTNPRSPSANIPTGLALSIVSSGGSNYLRLSGTDTSAADTISFTYAVDSLDFDGSTMSGTKTQALTDDPPLTLTGTFTSPASPGAYSSDLLLGGGDGTYTLGGTGGVSSGTLPPGTSLSIVTSGGSSYLRLSGTLSGSGSFTVAVNSGDGQSLTAPMTVLASPVLTGTYTASVQVLSAYSSDITISGGSGTYSNPRVTSGTLPAGLSLSIVNVSGTYKLRLSGTPSAVASYSFTAAIDDSLGSTGTSAQTVAVTADATALSIYNKIATAGGGNGAYWDLTEASGSARSDKANSYANLAELTNAVPTNTGPRGGSDKCADFATTPATVRCLKFSSSSGDGVDIPTSGSYCIFGWVYWPALTTTGTLIIRGDSSNSNNLSYCVQNVSGAQHRYMEGGSTFHVLQTTYPTASAWHFVCYWRDAADMKLRKSVDNGTPDVGVVTNKTAQSLLLSLGAEAYSGSATNIARAYMSRWGYISGSFLTSTEITWLMNGGNGRNWSEIKALAGH